MAETRSGKAKALLSATTANFGQFGARVAISPFVLAIAAEFSTSKSLIGLVLTGMWATYALMQFPSGVFADRYGERRIVLVALAMAVLGSIFVAVSPSLVVFAVAALVLGLGAGMYFAPGTALLDRRFTGTGRAFSIHSAGGPLAGLAVPVVGTWVAATYGWRVGILVGGAGALAALAMALVAVEGRPPTNPNAALRSRLNRQTVMKLLSRPVVAFSTVLGVIGMYVFQATVSFFPTFLQEHHGLTQGNAGLAMGVTFLLIAFVLPFAGEAADRWGPDHAVAPTFLVTATGFATLIFGPGSSVALWVGISLIGVGLTWGGAVQARVMREFDDDERGTGFGLVRTVFILLGSVGNVATGVLADMFGWPVAYGVVVGLLCFGVAILVINRRLDLGL
ncbi:MFS transporter [Halodesulfurarchaeum sp.]|uniref:MFS transporter n=1 Tax=Halodesulfurarchaeum sp. TaxID=1980530 RepID=UPI002FC2FBA7